MLCEEESVEEVVDLPAFVLLDLSDEFLESEAPLEEEAFGLDEELLEAVSELPDFSELLLLAPLLDAEVGELELDPSVWLLLLVPKLPPVDELLGLLEEVLPDELSFDPDCEKS